MTPDRGGRWLARSKHRRLLLESLEARTLLAGDTLLITEFMAANDTVLADANGDYPDWIEIHNPTNTPVDLAGWYLSDDPEQLDMWPLPAVMLDAGAYMIVFASGQAADDYVDGAGNFHANFKLSAGGESVLLVDQAQTVVHGFVDYLPQTADTSFGLLPDLVTEVYFTSPTPGGPADAAAQSVLITEIMYHSADESGMENRLEEYIELLNHGTAPVDLNGWRFSDGIDFVFSDVTIQPGEYLVVAADEAALVAKYPGVAHVLGGWTGRLSNSGESIELIDRSGVLIDRVRYADSGDWAQRRADPREQYGWI